MGYSLRLEGDVRKLMVRLGHMENMDKRGLSAAMSETIRSSTLERFKTQRDPDDKRWPVSIRARDEGGVTLTESAALKNSIHSKSDSSGFAVGTNKIYARTHQFGDLKRTITIRAKTSKGLVFLYKGKWIRKKQVTIHPKIPARRFLGLSEADMLEIKAMLEEEIMGDR